jgi:hypothetical protein
MTATKSWISSNSKEELRSCHPSQIERPQEKRRNLIERTFNKLKHWRRIATRHD